MHKPRRNHGDDPRWPLASRQRERGSRNLGLFRRECKPSRFRHFQRCRNLSQTGEGLRQLSRLGRAAWIYLDQHQQSGLTLHFFNCERPNLAPKIHPRYEQVRQDVPYIGFPFACSPDPEIAPIFRDWTSSAWPSWDELGRVAYDIRGAIGISPHAWGQAWITLGGDAAITVLAVICARHAAGGIKSSPGGLLRAMVDRHGKGTLRLDRTLFGLADKLKKAAVK